MRIRNSVLTAVCAVLLCLGAAGIASAAAMNDDAFIELCERGESKEIEAAIKAGANVNAKNEQGWTALMSAAMNSEQAVSLLLDAGADVNAKDDSGNTPLIMAARRSAEAIPLLLDAGADVNAKDNYGNTALLAAGGSGNTGAVSLLLKAGADINAKNNDGTTALMAAAGNDMDFSPQCFLLLLDNGADPDLTNPKSKEAIEYALSKLSDKERKMAQARLAGKAGGKASAASAEKVLISVDFAPNKISGEYDLFEEEYKRNTPSKIIFRTNVAAKDFKFIALEYDQQKAEAIKPYKVLYSLDALLPEKPLVVTWMEIGLMPHRGISFVDENNVTRYFSLSLSGEDGSTILVELE